MGFVYSIEICEISHQTFGPSHRKCPMCPTFLAYTAFNIGLIQDVIYFNPHLTCTCTGVDSRDTMPYGPAGLGPSCINVDVHVEISIVKITYMFETQSKKL